jgi:hypothetical protein
MTPEIKALHRDPPDADMDVRNLLKPLNVLDDPSIVGRIENEVASEWAVRDKLLAQNPAGHRRSELVTSRSNPTRTVDTGED